MLILPITTPKLRSGDVLAEILHATGMIEAGDIIVVSSKALATVEGSARNLASMTPTKEAEELAKTCHQDPHFTQAVINEIERLNGSVSGTCPWALLTSLKPTGMERGRILCPNAGLDQSNVGQGLAIGWPKDPVESVRKLKESLEKNLVWTGNDPHNRSSPPLNPPLLSSSRLAVILSDSCCHPTRLGVVAFALTCAGIDPVRSEVGNRDLFGKQLQFTTEAVADQLATAANAVMGNAGQSTPAAIVRDHGLPFSDFCGWVEGIDPEEDIFGMVLKKAGTLRKGRKGKRIH